MRHRSLVLAALVVLPFLAVSALSSVYSYPRHVDPLTVPARVSLLEVLRFFQQVSSSFARLDLTNVSYLLEYSRRIYVPENLRGALDRIRSLYSDLVSRVNETKTALSLAKRAFHEDNLELAETLCALAGKRLKEARATYYTLAESLESLANLARLAQTYWKEAISGVAEAIEVLERDIRALMELIESSKEKALVETVLSLYANETEVECFGKLLVWGTLADSLGRPLSNRVVYVVAGNSSYALRTDETGAFRGELYVQNYASRSIRLQARFVPVGLDRGLYRTSKSDSVELRVLCSVPEVGVWVKPPTAYPGSTVVLEVYSSIPGIDLEILNPFTKETVSIVVPQSLRYSMELRVPATAEPGGYPVEVRSLPRAGLAPTRVVAQVVVARRSPDVAVSYPPFTFSGLNTRVCVTVNTSSMTVLTHRYASVSKRVDHSDCLDVPVPLYCLEASLRLTLAVIPSDPTYAELAIPIEVKVYSTPLLATLLVAIALLMRPTRRTRRREGKTDAAIESPKRPWADRTEGDASVVRQALGLVIAASGVAVKSWQTFREFLQEIADRLPNEILRIVRRIFEAVELVLYGPPTRQGEALEEIRQLIRKLTEGRNGGGPRDG